MQLKRLFADDDAVSPVIGVILMVAITVILAAVIGAFVLGIGGDQATAPQATWGTDEVNNASGGVGGVHFEVTGVSGSQPDTDNLHVSAGGETEDIGTAETLGVGGTINASLAGSGFIADGEEIRIVWEEGGNQQILIDHQLTGVSHGNLDGAAIV